MLRARVIPCLLMNASGGLVKTVKFAQPKYVGDPINAVRIFNEKEVDELILLDVEASRAARGPDLSRIGEIVDEAFMPIAYGGGISELSQARQLVSLGVEKVIVNGAFIDRPELIRELADTIGSQGVVAAVDVGRDLLGRRRVFDHRRKRVTGLDPVELVRRAVELGAGEVFVNDVSREGTGKGFDLELVRAMSASVGVPVIVCGGAGEVSDLRAAVDSGASAVAAGSLFVYIGRHRAVMINYPTHARLKELFIGA